MRITIELQKVHVFEHLAADLPWYPLKGVQVSLLAALVEHVDLSINHAALYVETQLLINLVRHVIRVLHYHDVDRVKVVGLHLEDTVYSREQRLVPRLIYMIHVRVYHFEHLYAFS